MEMIKIHQNILNSMKARGFNELDPYTHKNPLVKWIFWKRLETLLSLARPADRVLDFGSGSGVFLPTLSKNFKEVHTTDLNTNSLEFIKKSNNLSNVIISQSNGGNKLPYQDNYFDIIFAADVLEHFHDSSPILEEFHRILKNDGILLVSGPTENALYKLSRRLVYWFWEKKEDHFSDINGIMQKSEKFFKIDKVKTLPSQLIPGFKIFRAKNE